jgi:hypothetical protein
MPAIKDRIPAGPAVKADMAAVLVSADNPAHAEEGIPLLPLPANFKGSPGRYQDGLMAGGPQPYHAGPMDGGPQPYCTPQTLQGQGFPMPPGFTGHQPQVQYMQPPCSKVIQKFANWNAYYSCGFDVANGHTSMLCLAHLCKALHYIHFNHKNTQQYIDLGHPCSMKFGHKTQFPRL